MSQEKRFRAKNPEIKKMSYNIIMHNPRLAKDSVKVIREKFKRANFEEKKNIIEMLRMASSISLSNSKNSKQFKRAEREKIFEIAIMYKALRRDLENELNSLGNV